MNQSRRYKPLPRPTGLNIRQRELWDEITSEIAPGMISRGNEVHLLTRLIQSHWRAEYLQAELQAVLSETESALILGGNNQAACNPLLAAIDRVTSTIAGLSQKLRLAPVSRLETKSKIVNSASVTNPEMLREPGDLLFAGAQPYTREEKERWQAEGKLKNFKLGGFPGYDNSNVSLLAGVN